MYGMLPYICCIIIGGYYFGRYKSFHQIGPWFHHTKHKRHWREKVRAGKIQFVVLVMVWSHNNLDTCWSSNIKHPKPVDSSATSTSGFETLARHLSPVFNNWIYAIIFKKKLKFSWKVIQTLRQITWGDSHPKLSCKVNQNLRVYFITQVFMV